MNNPNPSILQLHQLALYNTGRMPPDQVISAFAVRQPMLDRIMADLRSEKANSRAQHHLVIGQRGMGKTMLLARISAELSSNPDFEERFIPLAFAEEQYSVDRLSKFWLNCLDSLADALELANDHSAVDGIDDIVQKLTQAPPTSAKDDNLFAEEVYDAFAHAIKNIGRRPVLLVDNLQIVFERLGKNQQHALRELLMRSGAPVFIGASPSPPPQTNDYQAAFYDQFKTHYLHPLNESEMRELLLHLADVAGRDDVRQRVAQHPARLKVLQQLTGGNPRTVLTLFFLYAEDFAPNVFGDLEGLLDRVTPLYKARFEELTAQQQVITSAIANHWDPVTAAKLAQNTAIPQTSITPQLDRLAKTGVIERVELFGESRTGFQIAERFFNIWFLFRNTSRLQRRGVEFLTDFLEELAKDDLSHEREPDGIQESPDRKYGSIPPLLEKVLSAAGDSNWGIARNTLAKALEIQTTRSFPWNSEDWLQTGAMLIHLNYGEELLEFLDGQGVTAKLRPWVEAVRAVQIGDKKALQNAAPEIRVTAEQLFDGIERRLNQLPESTNRRPKKKKTRSRKQ